MHYQMTLALALNAVMSYQWAKFYLIMRFIWRPFFVVETFRFTESLDSVCIFKNVVYRHSRIKIHGDTFSYFNIVASVKDT